MFQPVSGPKWLFLDLNSYFASVEQQENPQLRGKPIAIVPMMTDGTCAIAASREAKKYGIKTGTKIYDARKMCPQLHTVLARHDKYVDYHHRVINEVIKHTPINKVWSIDELSSRLPPNKQNSESATQVALRIKKALAENVGTHITCSIGIAPNGFLAKVASDMQKPNGLVILTHQNLTEKLFALELRDLPGINVAMEERLNRAGITSVEDLWNISPKHARKVWGSVEGERFWYNLHGFDVPDRETNRSMVGHSRILDTALRAPTQAKQVTRRLTVKAASRLRRMEMHATRFDLSVRTDDKRAWSGGVQLQPSQDNFTFLKALDELWGGMLDVLKPRRLKKVSVTMHGLVNTRQITPDLFDSTSERYKDLQQKNLSLSQVIDDLNKRYGAETVQYGPAPRTAAGYIGTKVAFNRIPEMAEFHE
ncbi:MAG: impB/mucB/samB family protein [Alphaproteobacteria bacterium]|nr:impB/mucB/samB family protein [Alphaproteobacteria bacterium]